ncbi:ribonuclease H-like domain-containing protein [Cerioporus squamosus]|nr:ribonuclease H-like domain-containing protein [Cerioporus squamosus]
MSSVDVALAASLARSLLATVPLAGLALVLCILIILWRRLAGSRSCEGHTSPEQYQTDTKARTDTALPSTPATASDESLDRPNASTSPHEDDMIKLPKQPYDAFLVLDVEGTCVQGSGFDYPNEIIEWPVCLLRWKDKNPRGKARVLEVVDEFRSFVRPTWRPQLTPFCTTLTGITQEQVDAAPTFPEVLQEFRTFLEKNKLIDHCGQRLARFCFCTDGPHDIRDFVVKQCFISKIPVPVWLTWDVMDVRRAVGEWHDFTTALAERRQVGAFPLPRRVILSIPRQLHALGLEPFEGRQHSGIDDTRNICRLVVELARRGWKLQPNTPINPNRRWPWMGKRGKVLEEYYS